MSSLPIRLQVHKMSPSSKLWCHLTVSGGLLTAWPLLSSDKGTSHKDQVFQDTFILLKVSLELGLHGGGKDRTEPAQMMVVKILGKTSQVHSLHNDSHQL